VTDGLPARPWVVSEDLQADAMKVPGAGAQSVAVMAARPIRLISSRPFA